MKPASLVVAACALTLAVVSGCSSESDATDDTSTPSAAADVTTAESGSADAQSSVGAEVPDGLVIDVRIDGGAVTPTNERLEATVGEPITLRVDSDAEDELHVHSVPDHEFEVAVAQGQMFEFTVEVPGQVAIELHDSDRTVATVSVRS
nr:hypothetical protein [Rhodococcus sp. (in: high G+C Gram-positive bacteria)]